jgi:MFS family permease
VGRYKWVVLPNTALGVLMATIDISIMPIAPPDIFRGIHIDPLAPGNSFYLLWLILSFMVVTSVLVVSLGRLGDMCEPAAMYRDAGCTLTYVGVHYGHGYCFECQ